MQTSNLPSRPRGTAYVLVLAISMLVAVIGAAAVSIVRVQLRSSTMSSDAEEARLYAQSGIELAKVWCYGNATWRTDNTKPAGGTLATAIGSGSFTVSYSDPVDGNIANSPLDPLLITATGFKGSARQQVQCTLAPAPVVYSCLRTAITAGSYVTINGGDLTITGAPLATNANIATSTGCVVDGDCMATGTCNGTSYLGSKLSGVDARVLPGTGVFDYYIANGTAITYAATGGKMKDAKLSAANNPYGAENALGIYVVDCGGQTMKLDGLVMSGTLVLLNAKSDSTIEKKTVFTSPTPGMPALMVQGSITHNGDKTISGLVYVSGAFTNASDALTINGGLIVGGAMLVSKDLTVNWDGSYVSNPPPGFFDNPPMKVVTSSWKQIVN